MPVANRPIVNVHHQLEVRDLVLLLDGSQEEVLHALTPGWWKQALGTNSISLTWHIDVEAGFQSLKSTIAETGVEVTARPQRTKPNEF